MIDMLPLLVTCVSVLVSGSVAVLIQKRALVVRSAVRRVQVVAASFAALAAPYLAFAAVGGAAAVWGFYRSVWFVPGLILLQLAADSSVASLTRGLPDHGGSVAETHR